jgi:pectinesterase
MFDRRDLLRAAAASVAFAPGWGGSVRADAVVGWNGGPARNVYAGLAQAVAAAPASGGKPFKIALGKGVWRERVVIDKPNIVLIGAGCGESVLVGNRSAGDPGPGGKPIGTFGTATLQVAAPGFAAYDLTVANDFDYGAHLPKPNAEDKTGGSGSQAVALAIEGAADRCYLQNVELTGNQDTLYVNRGRSLFRRCRIAGCVDFIFGAGRAFFDYCTVVSRLRPGQDFNGFIAAPSTDVGQPVGLVFNRCRLEKEPGVAPGTVALGRPWRRTKTFPDGQYGDPAAVGACAYIDCRMDDHIMSEGWQPMGYGTRDGGRAMLLPEDARFYEYGSTGPGAGKPSRRRRMLTADEAQAFSIVNALPGWRV